MQEVYLRLLRHDSAKRVHKPLAYLYGIASHVLADYRNASAQAHEHLSSDDEDGPEEMPSMSPDDLSDQLNLQQQLERALAQLPATHAAVLLAHKHRGLFYVHYSGQGTDQDDDLGTIVTTSRALLRRNSLH